MAANGFHVADAYVSIHADKDPLKEDIAGLPSDPGVNSEIDKSSEKIGKRTGEGISKGTDAKKIAKQAAKDFGDGGAADFGNAGRDTGNKLTQGIQLSIVRNSPVIAAAIGGGLIAGGPVIAAAASVAFIGIAGALLASNAQVKAAWSGLWVNIKNEAKSDAASLVPYFVLASQQIGSAFESIRPQLRDVFSSLGPQITTLTEGLTGLVTNAMPGLVRMVQSAGPIIAGLAQLLERIGTGLSGMFDAISHSAGAGGQVLSELGSIIQIILPVLGQLMAEGAQIGANILPTLKVGFQIVADVLSFLAPIIPTVVTGFLAFKAVTALSGPLTTFAGTLSRVAQNAAEASYQGGALGGAAGRLSTVVSGTQRAVSGLATALPYIGIAVAAVSTAFQASNSMIDDWAKGLEQGGQAAATATQQLQDAHTRSIASAHGLGDAWNIVKGAFADGAAQIEGYSSAQDKATQKANEYRNSLSPLAQAQFDVTKAQNDYNYAVDKWGATSGQAIGAAAAYQDALQRQTDAQAKLDQAIHGTTQAMIDQANEALASANSQFAYQNDVLATKDAEVAITAAIKAHGAGSEEAQKATIGFGQALLSQAEAAGKAAADTSGLTDKTDLTRVSQQATLKELLALKQQYGTEFPAALQNTIDQLQGAGVKLDDVGSKKPTPQVKLDDAQFQGVLGYVNTAIQTLHGQKPTPTAFMATQPFQGAASWMDGMLTYLNNRHVTPSALLIANTLAAENAIDAAARNRTVYISTVYLAGPVGAAARPQAIGGILQAFAGGGTAQPMSARNAETVAPRTLRLIGDNMTVPESFIPQDGSERSWDLWRETGQMMAQRKPSSSPSMGLGTTIQNLNVSIAGSLDFSDPSSMRRIALGIRDAIVSVERETK